MKIEIIQSLYLANNFNRLPQITKGSTMKNIIMSQRIEQVQKYVKNNLPNNPEKLERIYMSLATLNDTINDIVQGKIKIQNELNNPIITKNNETKNTATNMKRYSSHNQISEKKYKHEDYFQRNKQQNIRKRHQALVRNLKSKGLRGNSDQIPLGIEIAERQDKKITKPLQLNQNIGKTERSQSSIKKCINRFNLNKDFYLNALKDGQIDEEKCYDKEMKMFLETRENSWKKINSKEEFQNEIKQINFKRYSHIDSLISTEINDPKRYQTLRNHSNFDSGTLWAERKSKFKQSIQFKNTRINQAQNLIHLCTDEIKNQLEDNGPKSLLSQSKSYKNIRAKSQQISNAMKQIKQKLQFDGMDLQNGSLQVNYMAKKYNNKDQIQKYTGNYIKAIINKNSGDNIIANKRDLIKNELKFRKVFADDK